jgi:hypothetical protein
LFDLWESGFPCFQLFRVGERLFPAAQNLGPDFGMNVIVRPD